VILNVFSVEKMKYRSLTISMSSSEVHVECSQLCDGIPYQLKNVKECM
jgi:hypothetical protein